METKPKPIIRVTKATSHSLELSIDDNPPLPIPTTCPYTLGGLTPRINVEDDNRTIGYDAEIRLDGREVGCASVLWDFDIADLDFVSESARYEYAAYAHNIGYTGDGAAVDFTNELAWLHRTARDYTDKCASHAVVVTRDRDIYVSDPSPLGSADILARMRKDPAFADLAYVINDWVNLLPRD
jgi:hypothetical protein